MPNDGSTKLSKNLLRMKVSVGFSLADIYRKLTHARSRARRKAFSEGELMKECTRWLNSHSKAQ